MGREEVLVLLFRKKTTEKGVVLVEICLRKFVP